MKTAIWLYLFMFVAIFDLHAQYPILSPFALSLGAAPSFIGLIMGVYSLTHLPGNVLAGYGVDRYGSRIFISISLLIAGIILLFQSHVTDPWQLLVIRSISGFVLAFLSPACMSLLAKLATNPFQQGKLMAGNGLVHTLASIVSPAAGAYLVAKVGFASAFNILGWVLILTGIFALFGIKDIRQSAPFPGRNYSRKETVKESAIASPISTKAHALPWLFYLIPLALSCSQGILFFELPLLRVSQDSILKSGILFSIVSLGALLTLSMLFLNRFSPFVRTACGSLALALTFFGMAVQWPLSLSVSLFMIGMAKGVIYPALTTLLVRITESSKYGKVFAILSVSFSIGAFIGPMMAGQLRDHISPYYIAFVGLMFAVGLLPYQRRHSAF
jgi:MFS family permease